MQHHQGAEVKIKVFPLKRDTIESFAEQHGLVMEVHERDLQNVYLSPSCRWYAKFSDCEVAERGMLRGAFGNGSTQDGAIAAYAEEISGKRLVFNARSTARKEITAPIFELEQK
jgi:hypothetical protein